MSTPALILWAIVFVVGVPSAWRNPTAGALVLCKIAGWVIYKLTGNNLPVEQYIFPDIFVIAVIFAKPGWQPCDRYLNDWHRFKCIALERSPADRAVLLLFAIEWVFYVAPVHDFYRWWILWGCVILQFLFASAESIELFRRSSPGVPSAPSPDDAFRLGWVRGSG